MKKKEDNNLKVYVCGTYYHLLIAIIKNLNCKGNNDIIITASYQNDVLAKDNRIIKELEKSKIFKQIYIFDYSEEQKIIKKSKLYYLKNVILIRKIYKSRKYKFIQNRKIYTFCDTELFGRYLNYFRIRYNLIEDGTDCFKYNLKSNLEYWKKQNLLIRLIKEKIFKCYIMGKSPLVDSIEVNDKKDVNIEHTMIIEKRKKDMFAKLSHQDKQLILQLFNSNIDVKKINHCSILITQPFWEDGKMDSEQQKIDMYKNVIEKHMKNDKVIIKPHPREKSDYLKCFENIDVIDKNFPIEILLFYDSLVVDEIVTVASTSINLLNFCNEKKYLGWEWFSNYNKGLKENTLK